MPSDLTREELEFLASCFDLAREGRADELAELLESGLPANLTNDNGDTLLILAAYHRQRAVVDLLLAHHADTARVNDRGQTALGSAIFRQDADIVTALLDAGADPDLGGQSAWAICDFFHLDEMRALLDAHRPGSPA